MTNQSYEYAIRRNELVRLRATLTSRLRFFERDERMADNGFERAEAKGGIKAVRSVQSEVETRIAQLREPTVRDSVDCGHEEKVKG
jgi:hypothetical protein